MTMKTTNNSGAKRAIEFAVDMYVKLRPGKSLTSLLWLSLLLVAREVAAQTPLSEIISEIVDQPGFANQNPVLYWLLKVIFFALQGNIVSLLIFVSAFLIIAILKGAEIRSLNTPEIQRKIHDKKAEMDKILFKKIITEILRPDYIADYIKGKDMGASFNTAVIDPMSMFTDVYCRRADFEFMDEELEQKRKDLKKALEKFMWYQMTNTFALDGNANWNRVPVEWRENQPERYKEVIERLEELSKNVWITYEEFVRLGRKKLHVEFTE